MRDGDIDDILDAAPTGAPADVALVDRIAAKIGASARPVRPLPRPWIPAVGLILLWGTIAAAGAIALGIDGLPRLSALQIAVIFPVLSALACLAAAAGAAQMTPGSRRGFALAPGWIISGGVLALAVVFAALFDDRQAGEFVSEGLVCLKKGLGVATPVALAGWLVLRRGFFVKPSAAGSILGALGGLSGITMLELHCARLQLPHILVWHTAVLPVSAGLGALGGWIAGRRGRKSAATSSAASRRSS